MESVCGWKGVDWRAMCQVQARVGPYGSTCRKQRASQLILTTVDNREQFTLVAARGVIQYGARIGMLPSNSVTGSADYLLFLELHNAHTCYSTIHVLFDVLF
jgi:hypothetical protein